MQKKITAHQRTANSFNMFDNDEDDGLWATSDEGEDTKLNSGVFDEGDATDFTTAYEKKPMRITRSKVVKNVAVPPK